MQVDDVEVEVITFLLQSEVIPLILHIMETGNEVSKVVCHIIIFCLPIHAISCWCLPQKLSEHYFAITWHRLSLHEPCRLVSLCTFLPHAEEFFSIIIYKMNRPKRVQHKLQEKKIREHPHNI
jgi:hypothetical protein